MVTNITRSYHEDGKIISQTKHKTFYWDGTFTGLKRLEAWLSEANPRDLGITEICLGMEGGDCGLSVRYSNINGFRHARLSPGCYIYVEESEVHVIPRGGLQKEVNMAVDAGIADQPPEVDDDDWQPRALGIK